MTDQQLYLAIGVPVLVNTLLLGFFWAHVNLRFDAIQRQFEAINQRFDDMRDMWRTELQRVEEVLDARLKHLEEKP